MTFIFIIEYYRIIMIQFNVDVSMCRASRFLGDMTMISYFNITINIILLIFQFLLDYLQDVNTT